MLELYRSAESSLADEVEEQLEEMVAAYRTEVVADSDSVSFSDELPAIRDGEEVVTGEENLLEYLDELRDLLDEWDRFGSDACYIEEDGSIC